MGIPSKGLTPVIQTLWPHHRSMARDMVMGGLTPTQLAVLYGFSQGQITRIINSPCFEAELARIEGKAEDLSVDVRKELNQMAVVANEILDAQLQNKRELTGKEQRDLCFGILDRSDYGKRGNGPSAARDLHLTKIDIHGATDKELRDDVMDLLERDYEE